MSHVRPRTIALVLAAGVAIVWWLRRQRKQQAQDFAAATFPVAPIPASFSYIMGGAAAAAPAAASSSSAAATDLNTAALAELAKLNAQLISRYGNSGGNVAVRGGSGSSSSGGLEFPFTPAGFTQAQVAAAAARYASGRSYGGGGYVPHMVMQEGHVEVRNGVPGVYIKYSTGGGTTTEWTPLH